MIKWVLDKSVTYEAWSGSVGDKWVYDIWDDSEKNTQDSYRVEYRRLPRLGEVSSGWVTVGTYATLEEAKHWCEMFEATGGRG